MKWWKHNGEMPRHTKKRNQLIIENVHLKDSGAYICWITEYDEWDNLLEYNSTFYLYVAGM